MYRKLSVDDNPNREWGPRPIITFIHEKTITEELAWELIDPFRDLREGRLTAEGWNLERVRERVRSNLVPPKRVLGFQKGGTRPPVRTSSDEISNSYVYLLREPSIGYGPDPETEADLPKFIPYPVFTHPMFQYFQVWLSHPGSPIDVSLPANSDWFMNRAQIVLDKLEANYAFCVDNNRAFWDPTLRDPRGRAWDLTYFGPDLSNSMGHDALESSHAQRVWADHRGGHWVQLGEMPFVPVDDGGAAREALAKHLKLAERFPQ